VEVRGVTKVLDDFERGESSKSVLMESKKGLPNER
jgi:hypothetical protein